jgi:hypothetical protein
MEDVFEHREGDFLIDDLGGPHDVAICEPLVYGLDDESALPLLRRICASLRPGGVLLVPRVNVGPRPIPALELYLYLNSGAMATTDAQFVEQLESCGFGEVVAHRDHDAAEMCVYLAAAV